MSEQFLSITTQNGQYIVVEMKNHDTILNVKLKIKKQLDIDTRY